MVFYDSYSEKDARILAVSSGLIPRSKTGICSWRYRRSTMDGHLVWSLLFVIMISLLVSNPIDVVTCGRYQFRFV